MRTRNPLPALLLAIATVALAGPHLWSADPAESAKIKKLVEQLGADSYAERQAATDALNKIGAPALDALREASKSTDAEVRKRAGELLGKIEKLAENKKILDPRMVHLEFKDTPLTKAVEAFAKKSEYELVLVDPQKKLKDVKVTVDTGKVTFWQAMEKFCEEAGVHDGDPNAGGPAGPGVPGGPGGAAPGARPAAGSSIDGEEAKAPALAPARSGAAVFVRDIRKGGDRGGVGGVVSSWVPTRPGQIYLLPGKPAKGTADTATAIRLRQADRKRYVLPTTEKDLGLVLQMAVEPKVRWQAVTHTRIEKALDDQGQTLKYLEEGRTEAPPMPLVAPAPVARLGLRALPVPPPAAPGGGMAFHSSANVVYHHVAVRLKKGDKETKSLKELTGTITGQALTEPEALLVVEDVLKATGKECKGKGGGEMKVTGVTKQPDGSTQIGIEFEMPDAVLPDTQLIGPGGVPMMPGKPGSFAPYGLRLVDDKGAVVPAQILVNWKRGFGVGAAAAKMELNATYTPSKEVPEPAKLVFKARRLAAVTVPFTLKDVEMK